MTRAASRHPVATPDDAALARAIERWFAAAARDLPWRRPGPTGRRDPYAALVSEIMLQQTQVSRVAQRFGPFIEQFPTPAHLAAATEDQVMAAWSGLGYYRRARLLHAAARAAVERFAGRIPEDPADLRSLPGVGRYTAGAIASIVHGRPEPIVDGNVARVLLRLHGKPLTPKAVEPWLWEQAGRLVRAAASPALFNEGLMELGATVCTPRAPRCDACPLAEPCLARRRGRQASIPAVATSKTRPLILLASLLARDRQGRTLVERRPARGLWASMWMAPTLELPNDQTPSPATLARLVGLPARSGLGLADTFEHATTHRRVRFMVWSVPRAASAALARLRPGAVWMDPGQIAALGLSTPARRILLQTTMGASARPAVPLS